MQIICPICGQLFERQGRQKRCVACTNSRYWEKYNQKYNGVSLEELQKKVITNHAEVEMLNTTMGQFMAYGDVTDKEIYLNKAESKKAQSKKYNQKQRDKRKAAKESSQIASELAEVPLSDMNEDEVDKSMSLN